jgi:hypothetical protein
MFIATPSKHDPLKPRGGGMVTSRASLPWVTNLRPSWKPNSDVFRLLSSVFRPPSSNPLTLQ